jgi:hypothetical protein
VTDLTAMPVNGQNPAVGLKLRLALCLCLLVALVAVRDGPAMATTPVPFGSLGSLQSRVESGSIVTNVSHDRFIAAIHDDPGHIAYEIAYLKQHPPDGPVVYLVGGSAVRECIEANDRLSAAIARRCGVKPRVRVLASSEQRLAGTLAIVDNLPDTDDGVIVIGIHHLTFVGSRREAVGQLNGVNIMAPSTALHDFMVARFGGEMPNDIRAGLKLHLSRYQSKRGVPAFRGAPIAYRQHHYGQGSVLPVAAKRLSLRRWLSNRGGPDGPFFTNFDFNAALLEECVKVAQAKGYQVLLMEDPQDLQIVGGRFDRYKAKYRPLCDDLVTRYGVHHCDINTVARLRSGDFFDLTHLVPSGRVKWLPGLATSLSQIFVDHYGATPAPAVAPAQ